MASRRDALSRPIVPPEPPEPGQLWYATDFESYTLGPLGTQDGWIKTGGIADEYTIQTTHVLTGTKSLLSSAYWPGGAGFVEYSRYLTEKTNDYQISFKHKVLDMSQWYDDTIEFMEWFDLPMVSNIAVRMALMRAGGLHPEGPGVYIVDKGGVIDFACEMPDPTVTHKYTLIVTPANGIIIKIDDVVAYTGADDRIIYPANKFYMWSEVYDADSTALSVIDDISLRYDVSLG